MRAQGNAAVAAILLALTAACAQRVAPAAPGPDATETKIAADTPREESPADAPAPGEELAKQALRQLFDHCAAGAYAEAAAYFLYDGSDAARTNRSALSAEDPGEAAAVEARCKNLASLIESSGGYAVVGYERKADGDGVLHRVQVSFSTPGEPTKRVFSLREVDGQFLLGDVE